MAVTISGLQNLAKNCIAYSNELGVALVSNGEDPVKVLSPSGALINAGITAPTVAPTVVDGSGTSLSTKANQYAVYAYVYRLGNAYPTIKSVTAINGSLNPRSQPSPYSTVQQVNGTGASKIVSVRGTTDTSISTILLFRTSFSTTAEIAQTLADSGAFYFVGGVANPGTATNVQITDNKPIIEGNPTIELDSYIAPQFKFCVWDGTYFWGWANHPLTATANWALNGNITFDVSNSVFYGRNGQTITFDGITTGGFDGAGSFRFKKTGLKTGIAYTDDENTAATLPASGVGGVVIQGAPTTLYRSKANNPFSWGYYSNIAGILVPKLWQLEISSGGIGTAIAIVPDQPLLKLDMEFPASCEVLNLQAAGTESFINTRASLSKIYSVTSHFSQFQAVAGGQNVLWGMDYKSKSILQCNGGSQNPIQSPIQTLLNNLTTHRGLQLLSHGAYDARSQTNCIWLTSNDPEQFKIDLCIYMHWPSGFWGVINDYDVICSGVIEDPNTSTRKLYVGTESGFIGEAFVPDRYNNWLPNTGTYSGLVASSTPTTVTIADGALNTTNDGIIGNYVVLKSADGLKEEVKLITERTATTFTVSSNFSETPGAGWKFYIGVIECSVLKYFNFGAPASDKSVPEVWATIQNVDPSNPSYLKIYKERSKLPVVSIDLKKDSDTNAWKIKQGLPSLPMKTVGIEIKDLSYNGITLSDMTIVPKIQDK